MPILGAVPGTTNTFVATGHGANGLLCGPVSGAAVADLVLGKDPRIDLVPFAPTRF
jgi:D-amino-acid dehydrogenase